MSWFKEDLLNKDFNVKDDHQDFLKGLSWVQAFGIAGPNESCQSLHLVVTYKYGQTHVLNELVKRFGEEICNFIEFVQGVEHPSFSFLVNDDSRNGADDSRNGADDSRNKADMPSSGDGIHIWGQDSGNYGSLGLFAYEVNGKKQHFASTCYHVLFPTKLSEDGMVRYGELSKDFSEETSATRDQWFRYLSREDKNKKERKEMGDCDERKKYNGGERSKGEECEGNEKCKGEECEGNEKCKGEECEGNEKCKGEECEGNGKCKGEECEKAAEIYFGKCLSGKEFRGKFDQEHDFALLLVSDDFERHGVIEDITSNELFSNKKIVEEIEKGKPIYVEKTGYCTDTTKGILKESGVTAADCFNYKNGYVIRDADPEKPFLKRGDSGALVKVLLGNGERYMFAYVVGRMDDGDNFCFNLKKSFKECRKGLKPCLKKCQKEVK